MKLKQNQRNFCIFILVVSALSYVLFNIDCKSKFLQLLQLYQTEQDALSVMNKKIDLINHQKIIQINLIKLQKDAGPYMRLDNKTTVSAEMLAAIMQAGEMSGLTIQQIEPEKWQITAGLNQLTIHLTMRGTFLQFIKWLTYLKQFPLALAPGALLLRAETQGMLQIDIQMLGGYIPVSQAYRLTYQNWQPTQSWQEITAGHDPFVASDESHVELTNQMPDNEALLQTTSVQQIKWVGYMAQGSQFIALAQLPNGQTIGVTKGMLLGIEKARVVKVTESDISVKNKGSFHVVKKFN